MYPESPLKQIRRILRSINLVLGAGWINYVVLLKFLKKRTHSRREMATRCECGFICRNGLQEKIFAQLDVNWLASLAHSRRNSVAALNYAAHSHRAPLLHAADPVYCNYSPVWVKLMFHSSCKHIAFARHQQAKVGYQDLPVWVSVCVCGLSVTKMNHWTDLNKALRK